MASTDHHHHHEPRGVPDNAIVSRQDIEAAMAKAVELRALHASLMQQGKCSSASPLSRHASFFSAQDYPVFTPSYEDEAMAGYSQPENPQSWKEYNLDVRNEETMLSDYRAVNASSRKGMSSDYIRRAEDERSVAGSCSNNVAVLRASPGPDYTKSRRTSLGDLESVSSCNRYKPGVDVDGLLKSSRKSNIVVPLTDSHSSLHSNPRSKGLSLSWLFPRLKKKGKNESSQPEEVSQMLNDLGMLSVETLKKELVEAHESRDAALVEAMEMKKSLGELSQKLEYLEAYCEEMKKALRQAVQVKNCSVPVDKLVKRGKSVEGNGESLIPVSGEVMVEGFLQMVSEARLSVKQFCKTLVAQIEETDHSLLDNLNSLLQPYKLSLNSKYSKAVLYHLEAVINQSLYQDFENCVFQKNGTPKLLDRQQECQARFQLFVALRNLSWNEVLRKGTKYYSDEFSKFCDQKMSGIIVALGWTRPWPEQLLQAFFVAAKCIWLLHLLAFSFNPALSILRVEENKAFEAHFMEDILASKQRAAQCPSRVKIMVMPGFYVNDHVLRCKVLCTYKSVV